MPDNGFDRRGDHGRDGRDGRGGWGRRGWDDWGFFRIPYPYYPYYPQAYAQPVYAQPVYAPAPVYTAPVYTAPVYNPPVYLPPQVVAPAPLAIPGAIVPGMYRITNPTGLNVRPTPDLYGTPVAVAGPGAEVQVLADVGNGWVRITSPANNYSGYICANCAGGPGGPWIQPSNLPFRLAVPSSVSTFFGQDAEAAVIQPVPVPILLPLGFRPRRIRGHKRRTVIARPEVAYEAKELLIPYDVAKHFDICSIRAGFTYLPMRNVPAELYAIRRCGGGGLLVSLPPVLPGQRIYLTVKNRSSHSHRFRAALNGIAFP